MIPQTPSIFWGGDDTVELGRDGPGAVEIFGGAGDDSIHVFSTTGLYGEEGNDTLTSYSGSSLYGGEGDDVLQHTSGGGDYSDQVSGGDGNDTIILNSYFGSGMESDAGNVSVSGGSGADHFEVNLELERNSLEEDEGTAGEPLYFSDFVPGERHSGSEYFPQFRTGGPGNAVCRTQASNGWGSGYYRIGDAI